MGGRTTDVNPSSLVPSSPQAKCFDHTCCRGWYKGTSSPVSGSGAVCLAPLCRLHEGQDKHRLSSMVSPPWLAGMMWSISNVVTVRASGVWQYVHESLSISRTWAQSAAGIGVLGTSVSFFFLKLLQRAQGACPQSVHRVNICQELVQFAFLVFAQVAFPIELEQLRQSFPMVWRQRAFRQRPRC